MSELDPFTFGAEQRCFGCGPHNERGMRLRFRREGDEVARLLDDYAALLALPQRQQLAQVQEQTSGGEDGLRHGPDNRRDI